MAKRILVVENAVEYREMLQEIVQAFGYEAMIADRATEALKILQASEVELVLLDIKMPAVQGDQLARVIRKRGNDVPIIAISGFLTPRVMEVLVSCGVRQVVAKPFKIQRLAQEIEKALESG